MKTAIAIVFISLCATMPVFSADWPMFRGNELRTGYYPDPVGYPNENTYSWKKSFGSVIVSSPAVVDNTLFFGSRDSCIYALDASSGQLVWKRKTAGWVDSSPLLNGNEVIVGSSCGTIYVVSKQTGEELAFCSAGFQYSSPAMLSDGTLVSGLGPPHRKFAAYKEFGVKWDTTHADWGINFKQMSYSSPAIYKSTITIGSGDGKLYGISIKEKDTLWSMQSMGGIDLSTPAIDNGVVYFAPGNYDKFIYAVDLKDGRIIWSSMGARRSIQPTRSSNSLHPIQFIQLLRMSPKSRDAAIRDLERQGIQIPLVLRKTRSSASANDFFPYGGMKTSSVAVDENNVYVIQKELGYPKPRFTLLALDKENGSEKWRFSELRNCVRQGFCSSPVAASHAIIFGWGEGMLYGLESKTGRKMWEDTLSGDIISSPAIADDKLYVATYNGDLYCYDLTSTAPGESFRKSTYCFPNPSRTGISNIQVYTDKKATVTIVVYNVNEKPVFRVNRSLSADEKFVHTWNLDNVANGVYFAVVKMKYSDGSEDKKILKIAVLH